MANTAIYLDNASTTRTDPAIAALVAEVLTEDYGNPSSLHGLGLSASLRIKKSTEQIKKALGIKGGKLYFTSGGTEANNTAIFGAVEALSRRGKTVVTTSMEHSSVNDSFKRLKDMGYNVKIVPANTKDNSYQKIEDIINACDEDTILVSAILINNETGVILDAETLIPKIRHKSPNAYIHLDGVQAVGKHPINLSKLDADLFTFSGHKIYAPKGIGCLYVKDGVRIKPLLFGGAQQDKIRPGTENVAYITALGQAVENSTKAINEQLPKIKELQDLLLSELSSLSSIQINSVTNGSPYITNISVDGIRSETLMHLLEEYNIYLSSGSACSKGAASHVLASAGLSKDRIDSAIRISLGKHNTKEDVMALIEAIKVAQARLVRKKTR